MSEFIVQELIDDGKLGEAIDYIDLNFIEQTCIRDIYKSVICLTQGEFNESLNYAKKGYEATSETQWHFQCSQISMSYAFLKLGNLEKAKYYTDKALDVISKIESGLNKEQLYWSRMLYLVIGSIYGLQARYDESIKAFEQCLEISNQINRDSVMPGIYNNLGYANMLTGNINKAHDYYIQSLKFAENIDNDYLKYFPISNLGNYYFLKGEIEKSERLHLEALELSEKIQHKANILSQYRDLSQVYRYKGNFDKAMNFLQKSLVLGEELGNPGILASILIRLIELSIETSQRDLAKEYLSKLKNIERRSDTTSIICELTKLGQALILKSENRIKPKSEAMELLKSIINKKELDYENIINAMLHLSELLLFEIRLTEEQEVFEELNSLIKKLVSYAELNNLTRLQVEIIGLQANIALTSGDFALAVDLTDKAIILAHDLQISSLETKLNNQKSRFISQSDEWVTVINKSTTLSRMIEILKVENYLQEIMKMKDKISKK